MKSPKRTSPDLLDYGQVGDRLNISEATVRRMVDRGLIRAVPVSPTGKRRMVRTIDLDDYIASNARYVPQPETPPAPQAVAASVAMKRAGWSGKDHLAPARKDR